ncbi:MAG TPA: peptidylprolyl isomerase, partial [Tepidisphaeraceae bacterium]|nr:peptidylprolyl isomerase [Tepidisphaeraceae bacterium]
MHRNCIATASTVVFLFILGGCGSNKHLPATLKPQSFVPPANAAPAQNNGGGYPVAKTQSPGAIDDSQFSVAIPATRPTTRPAVGASSGTFMYIGTVVAEVNGQPIYADKILAKVDAELSVKAPLLEPNEFREAARSAIRKQVKYDIALELKFAAAQRNSTQEEQERAMALAAEWRRREIIKAGGSLAVARRMSLDKDGIDFEEKVKEQYQSYMILIWLHGRLLPRVQISADDMRRFYDQNVASLFTEKSGVRFRAVYVSAKQKGGREAALKIAEDLLQRAAQRGEDFAKMARQENDDPIRVKNDGWWLVDPVRMENGQTVTVPRWIEKGSLRLEQVEKAAYAMQVGEVSSAPIDAGDGFYILKLEQKQNGRVRSFDEPDVQAEIRRRLNADQYNALSEKEDARLMKQSI